MTILFPTPVSYPTSFSLLGLYNSDELHHCAPSSGFELKPLIKKTHKVKIVPEIDTFKFIMSYNTAKTTYCNYLETVKISSTT